MAHASKLASDDVNLRKRASLTFQIGSYHYSLVADAGRSVYSVSDGKQSMSFEPLWAMGAGHMGQTYVYEQSGDYYESHVSYYTAVESLDVTTGHDRGLPPNLKNAAGRRMYAPETRLCFGCHTTASATSNKFDPTNLYQGVTCEACHGPGADHVAAEESGMADARSLAFNPNHLSRADAVDFCGACHRTTGDVLNSNWVEIGVMNVRFQPYRLQLSRCWEKGDSRLTCTSCHDPHQPLRHSAAEYDAACLKCHVASLGAKATADHPGKGCSKSTNNCVTCHMPRYELPGAHSTFTDHWIRVVLANEAYPN